MSQVAFGIISPVENNMHAAITLVSIRYGA